MDNALDAAEGERLQALLDEAFPAQPVDPVVRGRLMDWRGDRGSKLWTKSGSMYHFRPGRGMHLPGSRPNDTFLYDNNIDDVLAWAEKLDRRSIPSWMSAHGVDEDTVIALKRILRDAHTGARKRAAKSGLDFKLTLAELEGFLWQQKARCAVSGLPFTVDVAGEGQFRAPMRPSLDRIDNSRGYVPGNVRWVLTLVNIAMNDWGAGPLIEVARAIAAKHPHPLPQLKEKVR